MAHRSKRAKNKELDGRCVDERLKEEAKPRIDGRFRRVDPYLYRFQCYTKGRWIGRTILEVFAKEFRANTREYYEHAISSGLITVDGKIVRTDFVLQNNQLITNCVHRHEPPVTSAPIEIIHECDRFLAVDKPSSIPVHPCGRYRHNTVISLLGHEHNLWNLHTCHRLDRLTSGVLVLAKTKEAAQAVDRDMQSLGVHKEYLARVDGRFPDRVTCNEPVRIVNHRLGLCHVDPGGKPCKTDFVLVAYDEDANESIVRCRPHTGRMHQIRVHLKHLGHPIANDPLYGRRVWTRDATPAAVAADLDTALEQRERAQEDAKVRQDAKARQKSRGQGDVAAVEQGGARGGEEHRMVGCADCNRVYPDPSDEDMCLYLHACKFTCSVGTFTTRVPSWAQQPNNPRTPSQQQEQEQEQQQRWWSSSSCSLQ